MRAAALAWCAAISLAASGFVGCAGAATKATPEYQLFAGGRDLAQGGRGALRVIWRRELTPSRRGNYRPVEGAVAAIDERHGRVYVGAASGKLEALTLEGQSLYRFELHESIESEPALDVEADELYVATERGELYAFTASSGKVRWKVEAGAAIRRRPMLFRDAIYVITEDDVVEGRSRADGSILWSYKRERSEGFLVAGHAGMTLTEDGRLLTAFSDGTVVALDALDGRARWERDTALDVPDTEPGRPRYVDADATPVLVGDHVYAASFGAGLYCLDQRNGSVVWRAPEWSGVTGLAATEDGALILVSADRGVARFDIAARAANWLKTLERGSFGPPELRAGLLLVGDSKGSLIALDARSGDELGRIDAGHGFVARAALGAGRGFVLTNGGTLLAMRVAGQPL
jgi:outer membrane protein assembly factor BamB